MYTCLNRIQRPPITYSLIKEVFRKYSKYSSLEAYDEDANLQELIKKYDTKLQYNTLIDKQQFHLGYHRNRAVEKKIERKREYVKQKLQWIEPLPISLKYVTEITPKQSDEPDDSTIDNIRPVTFPYANQGRNIVHENANVDERKKLNSDEEIRLKYERMKEMRNWMTAYDNYGEYAVGEEVDDGGDDWKINYGTPDPKMGISQVPCGGCGAHLHCKDTAIPGYIPSEIFKNHREMGGANLEAIICQRCYFLKNYNMALQVNVTADDYTKVLLNIRDKRALVILLVDLMDFPCSIWPGIADILGPKTPIIIVGNKVDLIPKDDAKYLSNIKEVLVNHCKLNGFGTANIKNVSLISAKTGYGIEDLITKLYSSWKYKGDVYLVGCTNAGKSSLFNVLLQSDYCKVQASDLIQRATTSLWPGTTLNLLKFPILRPAGYRLVLRHQRLQEANKLFSKEEKFRKDQLTKFNSPNYATLIGHIGKSFRAPDQKESLDLFSVTTNSNASGKVRMGVDERHPDYITTKWCYDTPGVIQPDQIINLLTTEELMLTIPKQLIRPQTFGVKPGTTLFIAGLGRLDYVEGPGSVRLTVFRSGGLPVTICDLEIADDIYKEFVGKELFAVPIDTADRMLKWPGLERAKEFTVIGKDNRISSNDIVLSSAGWIAINVQKNQETKFIAWTPEKRGCYLRECLLPKAVLLRGKRRILSPAYSQHRFI